MIQGVRAFAIAAIFALGACGGAGGDAATRGGSSATAEESGDGDLFDVGSGDAGGNCDPDSDGGMMGEEYDFINLWVANSTDGTVSKIDTRQQKEVARYRTAAEPSDPSRTSVNLLGDMVVVNRGGSITKILGRTESCPDQNGLDGLQTSTGPNDVLAWGQDDCVAWHRELTQTTGNQNQWGPRPVAWEGAELDPDTCTANPRVWVGWYANGANKGEFRRLDGHTGDVQDEVSVPWAGAMWGPYGGAVNKQGDFWVIGWQRGPLVRIHEDGSTYDVYDIPDHPGGLENWTYGIALDESGRPWISSRASVMYFDPETEEFGWIDTGNEMMRGMGADRDGNIWVAVEEDAFEDCALAVFDYEHDQLLAEAIKLPGCSDPVGVSADAEGFVWVIDHGAQLAFRVDPETYMVEQSVGGLINPYTYSDMTGAGLNLVFRPQEG